MTATEKQLWSRWALVDGALHKDVLMNITPAGQWHSITPNTPRPAHITPISLALPGIVNAHSHAFQRAFAGLSERRQAALDDFWSWRETMYAIANRINPAQMEAVAARLYLELLRGGFTHVCEFNYVCRDLRQQFYQDADSMEMALLRAARKTGMGITLMPVLYERAGFSSQHLNDRQLRFATDVDACLQRLEHIRQGIGEIFPADSTNSTNIANVGLAIHSLRAARPDSVIAVHKLQKTSLKMPIHIHVAEQTREVDDCLTALGHRPIQWLIEHHLLDSHWALVHATHTTAEEIAAIAEAQATVVLCPTTEANLGDGIARIAAMTKAAIPLTIGTDSHINRHALEDLRLMEYSQRLALRQRNVLAAPPHHESTAQWLWQQVVSAGARPSGHAQWGFCANARADLVAVDVDQPSLAGIPAERWLDALLFSTPSVDFPQVMVKGQWVVRDHHHPHAHEIDQNFVAAMQELLSSA